MSGALPSTHLENLTFRELQLDEQFLGKNDVAPWNKLLVVPLESLISNVNVSFYMMILVHADTMDLMI